MEHLSQIAARAGTALVIVLALLCASGVSAQPLSPDGDTGSPEDASPADASAATSSVQVHGDWTIDVQDPDGTVAEHREFSNSLVTGDQVLGLGGDSFLTAVLSKRFTMGAWYIALQGNPGPCAGFGSTSQCMLDQDPTSAGSFPGFFNSVKVTTLGSNNQQLQISGSFSGLSNGQVDTVSTGTLYCQSGLSPDACTPEAVNASLPPSAGIAAFTQANVSPPISVTTGQLVGVVVIISFS